MHIFFDTETTGLCKAKLPASDPCQPRICQLGAILADPSGRVTAEINFLVKPDGWTIPEAASRIHGITQQNAERYGLSIKGVLSVFNRLLAKAERIVAHNIGFDVFMLEIECVRSGVVLDFPLQSACTMDGARDVLKLPPTPKMAAAGITGFKSPNLQEAFRYFFGRDFEGAHDAMADVRACRDVYYALSRPAPPEIESSGVAA